MEIRQIDIKGERYYIESYINPIPTGTVLPFAGLKTPEGFLLCDGSEVSRVTYAKLFDIIGTIYGAGDGSTTFNLPEYRETVLVGAGGSSNSKIRAHDIYEVGEFKDDQIQGHKHIARPQISSGESDGKYKAEVSAATQSTGAETGVPINDGINGTPRTGDTTHGKQIGINFIIKV